MNEPSPITLSSPDASNRSAGETIKRARESQGMTLEALASMIKVTPAKLDALELGRYDLLPDANFTRALAMTVCRALKVDPGEVLAALPAARPAPLAQGKPPLNQPFKESKGGTPLFDRNAMNWSALLMPRFLAPAALLIGAVLIYVLPDSIVMPNWLSSSTGPAQPTPVAPADVTSVAQPPVQLASAVSPAAVTSSVAPLMLDSAESASAVSAAGPSAVVAAPVVGPAAVPVAVPPPVPASVAPPAPVAAALSSALTFVVTASTWVEVKDAQGNKLFSRLARSGENVSLDGPAPLQVRIGNVSGIQMRFKGQPVDLSSFTRNNVARIELK